MNTLLDHHESATQRLTGHPEALDEIHEPAPTREFTLGTATILAIFFALALICAACFAFGYSLGSRHSTPSTAAAAQPAPAPVVISAKPSPGSPAAIAVTTPAGSSRTAPAPLEKVTVSTAPAPLPAKTSAPPARAAEEAPAPAASPVAAPGPIVQVAAVSHQEDAELIASTLKRRGYAVAIRTEPQDKLFHLQLGPFPDKKDAEAMRQRLLADGFNAYIK